MTLERYAGGPLRTAFAISGRCVEIVHAMRDSSVDQTVDHLLINLIGLIAAASASYRRPAHTPIAEQRHFLARLGIGAIFHLVDRDVVERGLIAGHHIVFRITADETDTEHRRTGTEAFQEIAAVQTLLSSCFIVVSGG